MVILQNIYTKFVAFVRISIYVRKYRMYSDQQWRSWSLHECRGERPFTRKKENKNENIGKFVGAKGMHCFMAKQSMNETIYPENLGHFIAIFLQQFRGMLICS